MTSTSAIALQDCHQELATKLEALGDAVSAARETFRRRIGAEFDPVGAPAAPECQSINYGATIALTGETANYTFALVCDSTSAAWLARRCGDLGPEDDTSPARIAEALCEIPSAAAGRWQECRGKSGARYQLGMPLFMRGRRWLTYFGKGVHAIAQRLAGPDGVAFQVVMIWQSGVKPGGVLLPTTGASENSPVAASLSAGVLNEATGAVIETCEIQLGLTLTSVAVPNDPGDTPVECGSIISLTCEQSGGWNLAVTGSRESCEQLTRVLFAMEPDEEPAPEDIADGVGEIANVAAGVFKASRRSAGERLRIGLPLFLEGRDGNGLCPDCLQGLSQRLDGLDGIVLYVTITWR